MVVASAAPDVGQIFPRWLRSRALVQVDRNLELAPYSLSKLAGEGDTVIHRRSLEWNERNDVGGADARMLSSVRTEVYSLGGGLDARERGFHRSIDGRYERDDRPVVRRV